MLRWWAALGVALCVAPMPVFRAHLSGIGEPIGQEDPAAKQLLERAGNALGGADRLRAISRLRITAIERESRNPESGQGRTFKVWLPDRFQSNVAGLVTHTLNGGRLTIDREVPPEVRRNAEQAIPGMFRNVALAFLLRTPSSSAPRLHGEVIITGLKGTLVEFTAQDGKSRKLLLAPKTAHPLALVYSVRAFGSTEQRPDLVWRLEDYRIIDGVRFPFRLTIVFPQNQLITEVKEIEVNPRFTPADFPS